MNKKYIYEYPNQSIEPYLQLLNKNYLVDKLESDLMQNYVAFALILPFREIIQRKS